MLSERSETKQAKPSRSLSGRDRPQEPDHVLLQAQDAQVARGVPAEPLIGEGREPPHMVRAAELGTCQRADRVALAACSARLSCREGLDVVAEGDVLAPRALGSCEHPLLRSLKESAGEHAVGL